MTYRSEDELIDRLEWAARFAEVALLMRRERPRMQALADAYLDDCRNALGDALGALREGPAARRLRGSLAEGVPSVSAHVQTKGGAMETQPSDLSEERQIWSLPSGQFAVVDIEDHEYREEGLDVVALLKLKSLDIPVFNEADKAKDYAGMTPA
jgi:hypothetical protein